MRKTTSRDDEVSVGLPDVVTAPSEQPSATTPETTHSTSVVTPAIYADHSQCVPTHYTAGLLPEVREQYELAYRDPQLLSIRDNIALMQARRVQMIARIELGDSVGWRTDLRDAWDELLTARSRDDHDSMRDAFNVVAGLMKKGGDDEQIWDDIRDIDRDLVKWKKMQHDRLNDLRVVMTLTEAAYKLHLYHMAVLEIVSDDRDRAALEIRRREVFQAAGG